MVSCRRPATAPPSIASDGAVEHPRWSDFIDRVQACVNARLQAGGNPDEVRRCWEIAPPQPREVDCDKFQANMLGSLVSLRSLQARQESLWSAGEASWTRASGELCPQIVSTLEPMFMGLLDEPRKERITGVLRIELERAGRQMMLTLASDIAEARAAGLGAIQLRRVIEPKIIATVKGLEGAVGAQVAMRALAGAELAKLVFDLAT